MTADSTAREALRAWISGDPRDTSADAAARAALKTLAPDVAGGVILQRLAARARTRAGSRDPIPARVVELLLADGRPEPMLVLGLLAHWPRHRFSNPRYPAAFVAADGAHADWRALLLRRAGGRIGASFRIAGATAPGNGDDAAYLRAVLLERAMNLEITWDPDVWAAQIAPHVDRPIFWRMQRPDGRATVVYGDRELPLAPTTARDAAAGVRVLHPAALAPEQRAELATLVRPEDEPFAQIHRPVHAPTAAELPERMIRRYRERAIEETVLFGHLRRRGWRRGEIMDYPRFFEMHLSDPECAWRPYIRMTPGIYSGGPEPGLERPNCQRIHAVSFQRRDTPGPHWGGYLMTEDRGSFADHRRPSSWETPERLYGERLADVSPVVVSETLWTLWQLAARGAPA